MFARYVYEKTGAEYNNRLLIVDRDELESKHSYAQYFSEHGFLVIKYSDDLHFRVEYGDRLNDKTIKIALLVFDDAYIPYDIRKQFRSVAISVYDLYPKFNSFVIQDNPSLNYDLLTTAYVHNYEDLSKEKRLSVYQEIMYSKNNVREYLEERVSILRKKVSEAKTYADWCCISEMNADIKVSAAEHNIDIDIRFVNKQFKTFVLADFGKLSSVIDRDRPVLVSRAMEYMSDNSKRFVVIVMDGMSQFDWKVISKQLNGIHFRKTETFAMIPTTTSVSRQCLLSNKYPSQLVDPWKQSKEKEEFLGCALTLGYSASQVEYKRGYDADFSASTKCGAVIINDIDDMVHGQKQGQKGMYHDANILAQGNDLRQLVQRLVGAGFDVYITADHGNTPCTGMGKLMKTGVETETKSRRMIVLKDYADTEAFSGNPNVYEYPKYYLNKAYQYYICDSGYSFDSKGETVMSHGGATIDEVIVPFVIIKAGEQ